MHVWRSVLRIAAAIAVIGAPSYAQEPVSQLVIHTGPERSSLNVVFGPILADSLGDKFEVALKPSVGTIENLEAVLANPDQIAFAQRDLFDQFVAATPDADRVLELYGEIPFCVGAVARRNSPWTLPPTEMPSSLKLEVVDVGRVSGDAYRSLRRLISSAPRFDGAKIEHRGASRAIARVRRGDLDVALFLEYPGPQTPIIEQSLSDDRLRFVGNIAGIFFKADTSDQTNFVLSEVVLPLSDTLLSREQTIRTICTTVGVAVNAASDPDRLDAIIHPIVDGVLTDKVSLSFDDVGGVFQSVIRRAHRLYDDVIDMF